MTTPIALQTAYGQIIHADSLAYMRDSVADGSVDLIFTSPPFALLRKKDYGNVEEDKGEVGERLQRHWTCCETVDEYVEGAKGRFHVEREETEASDPGHYKILSSVAPWNGIEDDALAADGGSKSAQAKTGRSHCAKINWRNRRKNGMAKQISI